MQQCRNEMSKAITSGTNRLVTIHTKTPPTRFSNRLQTGTTRTLSIDVALLAARLRANVEGEVRFAAGDRGMYASDASNYRMVPIGVVLPKDVEEAVATVLACREFGA